MSSSRWPAASSARSRLRHRAAVVHAGVHEHDPVAGLQRPGVAVRHAGQVERQPQPPDAGQHPLAAAHLSRGSGRLAHAARHATVPAMAKKGRRREKLRAPESEYRDEHGSLLVLRGSLTPATRQQYAEVAGGNILSQEDAWQRAVEFLFERLAVRWEIAGRRADHAPEGAARPLPLRLADERRWIRDVAARAPRRALPGHGGTVNVDGFARAAHRLLPRGAAGPAGAGAAPPRSPRRCCSRCSASCSSARRGRCCAPTLPGQARGLLARGARRAPRRLPLRRARRGARRSTPRCGSRPPRTRTRSPASTRRGWPAPRAPAAPLREVVAAPPLGDHAVADRRRRPAGRHGHARVRGLRRRARCSSTATTRPPPGASCATFQAGLIERLAPAREIHIEADGHRPDAQRRGPHLGQLRRQAQHAVAARSSPGRTRTPPRA